MKQNYKIDKLLLELSSDGGSCSVDDGGGSSTPVIVEGDTLYPQSLKVTKEKVTYNQDETLNLDDLVVECTYTDGSTAIIKNYATNANEIDMGFAGYKPLTVTYCHNGIAVSAKVGITVKNTDSYNNIQLAYKIVRTGTLKSNQAVVTNLDKIMQYSKLKFRIKAKFVVEQNYSKTGAEFGFGENTLFGNKFMGGKVTVKPYQVGEFVLNATLDLNFERKTISKGTNIIFLTNNGYDNVQGYFELLDVSLAYTEPVAKVPMSISASKVITRAIIGEDFISDDITATVTYNDESTANVTPVIKLPDEFAVGDNTINVEYSAENRTVTTTLKMHYYKQDKTEPDEFHDMTAREWCEAWKFGINWGNALDSKANGSNKLDGDTSHQGDTYIDFQETCWGQPAATLKNFQDIKEKGFDMVRIPVTWCYNSYTEPERDENDLKVRHIGKFWACRVAEVVDLALEAGLYVMINMHHEQPIIFTASTRTAMKQVYKDVEQCWTEIAEKFKHYNEKLCFEGFNEVDNLEASWQYGAKAAQQMNDINQIFVNCVRKSGSNNAKRVLHCPTLIHSSDNRCINDWVYPNDTVKDHIAMNVHIYDTKFLQNLDHSFETLEHWSEEKGVPICIGEWGTNTKNGDYDFRARHAQNYTARAKYHHLYPVFWDNGSDYELVKKYNRIHEYNHPFEELQKIIDGLQKGYNEMKAFRVPNEKLIEMTDPNDFEYNQWTPSKGFYWTGWGYCTMKVPCKAFPKASYAIEVTTSGQAYNDKLQFQAVRFMKTNHQADGSVEYEIIESVGGGWHNSYVSGKVPEDADCILITMTCADKKVEGKAAWQPYFDNGELALTIMQYEESDIEEVQLEYRKPVDIIVEKKNTKYVELNSELNLDDIHVAVKFNDEYIRVLSAEEYTVDTSKVDMSKKGQYYLDISTTIDGVKLTAQIEILVGALLAEISANPTELVSKVGNTSIDTSSITVTAKYADDSASVLEAGTYTIDTSAVKLDEVGTYDIVITYTELNIERTCTVACEVYDKLECKGFTRKEKSDYEPYAPDGQLDPVFNGEKPNACAIRNIVQYRYDKYATTAPEIYIDVLDITKVVNEYHVFISKKYITKRYAAWENKNTIQAKNAIALGSNAYEGQSITAETITDSLGREWIKLSFKPPVGKDFTEVSNKVTIGNPTMPVYVTSEADLSTIEIAEDASVEEENTETNN